MAHLTNFSFEFFYEIFTEDASLRLLYHGAKKSKMTKNSNHGGGGEGVINGHSKECRSFDVDLHCNTFNFKIRFWAVYTQAYGGAGAIAPERAAAKRGHHPFFFWSEKKGGSSAPSEPPLATCLL